jgi:hypothetical protein
MAKPMCLSTSLSTALTNKTMLLRLLMPLASVHYIENHIENLAFGFSSIFHFNLNSKYPLIDKANIFIPGAARGPTFLHLLLLSTGIGYLSILKQAFYIYSQPTLYRPLCY